MSNPAPNLEFLRRFRTLAYLLVILAISGFAYAESNPFVLAFGFGGVLLSWFLVENRQDRSLPRWLINLGVLVSALVLFYEIVLYQQDNLLVALGHFMVAILICKLFESKNHRDYAQILTLSLLVMVAGSILTSSLFFALLLAGYLLLGLYAILVFHLRFEAQNAIDQTLVPADLSLLPERHDTLRRDIRRITYYVGTALILISALAFTLFPRHKTQDLLASWALGPSMRTGFSESVRLTDYGRIQQSEEVVMEVKLEQNDINIGSEFYQPYFRGIALDAYDSRSNIWLRSPLGNAGDAQTRLIDGRAQLRSLASRNSVGLVSQQYTIHMLSGNLLFCLTHPVSVSSDQFPSVLYSSRDGTLVARDSLQNPLRYTIESAAYLPPENVPDVKPLVRPGDLGHPGFTFDNEESYSSHVPAEVVKIARDVAGDLVPPPNEDIPLDRIDQIAKRYEGWLRRNYRYSLIIHTVNRSLDPTADFLLNRKTLGGHCEYFASAMVMMCRAVGINARMATGFHGGDFNSLGGYYVVRKKDAHAWVEVFLPGRGWTLFDPTPGDAGTPGAFNFAWLRWVNELGEIIQKNWLSMIVAFDNTSRHYLYTSISGMLASCRNFMLARLDDIAGGLQAVFADGDTPFAARLIAIIALGMNIFCFGWMWRYFHRRRHSHLATILSGMNRKTQKQLIQDLMFFDDLLRLLRRSGHHKPPDQTPREFVNGVAPCLHAAAPDARWLVDVFYDIRFGMLRMSPALQIQIHGALTRLREQITRK